MADFKVLFVCMGNICRSPAAEGVLKHKLEAAGISERVLVDSAGTIAFHVGNPADSRMREAASRRGINLTSHARQIQTEDLETFDWIVTMDRDNFKNVRKLPNAGQFEDKIMPFCDFCMEHADKEVPDPYYGGDQGFEHVLNLLEDGCTSMLNEIQSKL